ncbi:MAG: hypothetical protein IJF08_07085 [Clostridia bacterium]|nr:hypothetical protein [Clostridia bacterium]
MKANDFLHLLGEIDDDLIVNAKKAPAPKRSPAWRKTLCIAAAACLIVGILTATIWITMRESPKVPPVETDTDEVTTDSVQNETQDTTISSGDTTEPDITDQPGGDVQIETPYTVLVIGPYDGSGKVDGTDYVIKENKTYTDSTVAQKYAMTTDDGQSLEFVYQKTNSESFSGLVIHTYKAENGIEIKLNQNLDQIMFYNEKAVYKPDESKTQMTEQECLQIAQEYLMGLTEYADQYNTHLSYDYDGDKQGGPCYGFRFTRLLGNYTTYDVLIVSVSKTGDITVYNQCNFGCADGITLPSEQEYTQMQASAIKAMEKMYEGRKYTYELRDVYISYDAQGKLAVEFMIDMDVWPKEADENSTPWAELCHLLIYPEDLAAETAQEKSQ